MKTSFLIILLLTCALRADDGEPDSKPPVYAVEADQTEAIKNMSRQLADDPGLQEALVDRIMPSQIADAISDELDTNKKRSAVRDWVRGDLVAAAEMALGLKKDDVEGAPLFENSVVKYIHQTFRRNNTDRGAYGVLKSAAKTSQLVGRNDQQAGEEERRESLRNLFEGKGAQDAKVITGQASSGKAASDAPASAVLSISFYDRLSTDNIHGYSPQLMSFQNALNTRRPPGAPILIETGKLDYATLAYPAHGLKYDLRNLEDRLRRARIAELAAMGGVQLTERDMDDPNLEARLRARVPAGKLSKRFAARAAANARAQAALFAFNAAAEKSRDSSRITKTLLLELSSRQREAARWLTVASLEEELSRITDEEDFLTAELIVAIDAVPLAAPIRELYKRRGESYKERASKLKAQIQITIDALLSVEWLSRTSRIEKMINENTSLRRKIMRDMADYRFVPVRIAAVAIKQARWQKIIDEMIVKYAKFTPYGRAIASRRDKFSRYLYIFGQIASGDISGAHLSLVNSESAYR